MSKFSEFLHEKRIATGYTLREFCQLHDFGPRQMSALERGVEVPPIGGDFLMRLRAALRLPIDSVEWNMCRRLAVEAQDLGHVGEKTAMTRENVEVRSFTGEDGQVQYRVRCQGWERFGPDREKLIAEALTYAEPKVRGAAEEKKITADLIYQETKRLERKITAEWKAWRENTGQRVGKVIVCPAMTDAEIQAAYDEVHQEEENTMKKEIHPNIQQLLRYFEYQHLPERLQQISKRFHDLAWALVDEVPESPEVTVMIRKLLEAKDCAVRAALPREE